MSESSSVNTNLTTSFFSSSPQEFFSWFTFNMKLIVFIVIIIVLLSLVLFPASMDYDIMYDNINNIRSHGRNYRRSYGRSHGRGYGRSSSCPYCNIHGCKGDCMEDYEEKAMIMSKLIQIPRIVQVEIEETPKEIQQQIQQSDTNESRMSIEERIKRDLEMDKFNIPVGIAAEIGKEINIEQFSNEEMMSYSYERSSEYQSIPLLALFDENNNPKNLFFGQANRYVISKNSKLNYRLEIYCNLLVLNGNIYDTAKKVDHMYKVILINTKNGEQIFLDKLKKDGDGMYKLKFNSLDKNKEASDYIGYDKIQIVYSLDGKDEVLLEGKFK